MKLVIKAPIKNKIHAALTKPLVVILVIALATFFSYFDRNYGYFFGIGIAFLILWGSNFRWADFGFAQKINIKTVIKSIAIAVSLFIGVDIFIQPLLEIYFGQIDLSSLDHIRNDFGNYLMICVIMWVFAAFGEEFLFTGYYMKRVAELFGGTDRAWLASAIVISAYFGISHYYQGPAGMIAVGMVGFVQSLLFYKNRKNLALIVLIHGFYDMIGLTLLYLDKYTIFYDWTKELLQNI